VGEGVTRYGCVERDIHELSAWPHVSGSIVHKVPVYLHLLSVLCPGRLLAISAKGIGIGYQQCISN